MLKFGFGYQIEGGPHVKAVHVETLREEFCRHYIAMSDPAATAETRQEAKRKAFKRQFNAALIRHLIGARSNDDGSRQIVWLASCSDDWVTENEKERS